MSYNGRMVKAHPAQAVIRPWLAYMLVALVAFIVFLPWAQGFFLGDDWMLLGRNTGHPLPDQLRQASDASNSRWYRPLSEWSLALSWSLFGLNPVGHHILNSVLHAFNAVLVTVIGRRLTRDVRVGLLAGLSFGVLACHTEAVVWITARHEMLASGLALLSLISYIRFRDSGRFQWWLGAVLSFALSLGFKETTLALPLFLLLYDTLFVLPSRKNVRLWRLLAGEWIAWLLPLALGGGYLLFRLKVGGGYAIPFNLLSVLKNFVYYLLMEMIALPVSTHFVSRFPVLVLPVLVTLTVGCAITIWQARARLASNRAIWFGAAWMVFALAPVILIVAERTTYFSSVGWAWVIGVMLVLAWDATSGPVSARRWLSALAIAAILGANLVTLTHRSYWWNHASEVSRNAFSQLRAALADLPQERGSQLWLVNPPRRIEYAEALGSRLLFAVWLLQGQLGTDVQVVLVQDREVGVLPLEDIRQLRSAREITGPVVAFYWQGESLVKWSIPEGTPLQ